VPSRMSATPADVSAGTATATVMNKVQVIANARAKKMRSVPTLYARRSDLQRFLLQGFH
jgi:hypothetical protein